MRASVNCLSTVPADKKCFETETSVDATAQVTVGRRNIESWILVEEARGVKRKTGRDHGLDREILGAGNMVQAKAVPDHDIGIDQRDAPVVLRAAVLAQVGRSAEADSLVADAFGRADLRAEADLVLEAAEYVSPQRLGTTDDCGFAPFSDDTSRSRETAAGAGRTRRSRSATSALPTPL